MKIKIVEPVNLDPKDKLSKKERIYISLLEDTTRFSQAIIEGRRLLHLPTNGVVLHKKGDGTKSTSPFTSIKNHPYTINVVNKIDFPSIFSKLESKQTPKKRMDFYLTQADLLASTICHLFRLNVFRWSDPLLFLIFFDELIITTKAISKVILISGSTLYENYTDPKLTEIFGYKPETDKDIYLELNGPFTSKAELINEIDNLWPKINRQIKKTDPSTPVINKPTIKTMQRIYRERKEGKSYDKISDEISNEAELSSTNDGIEPATARQMHRKYKILIKGIPTTNFKSFTEVIDKDFFCDN